MILLAKHRAQSDLQTRLIPPKSSDPLNYLGRIDFFDLMPEGVEIERDLSFLSSHRRNESHFFTPVLLPRKQGVRPICEVVAEFFKDKLPGWWRKAYDPFQEVISNIEQHASYGRDTVAYSCAQVQVYSNRVELAFGDLGVGFKQTLRSNPAHAHVTGEERALHGAFEHRHTRQHTKDMSHHGGGLHRVGEVVRDLKGKIRLHSGDGFLKQSKDGGRSYGTLPASFPGTLGWVRIPT